MRIADKLGQNSGVFARRSRPTGSDAIVGAAGAACARVRCIIAANGSAAARKAATRILRRFSLRSFSGSEALSDVLLARLVARRAQIVCEVCLVAVTHLRRTKRAENARAAR
jgi:hypothetical protein